MIEIHDLAKRFGKTEVLRGIDLSIARGRVMAIVGPNGAGKTTLIKCVLGLARPDAGRILVDGVVAGPDDGYRSRIGYMPQLARFPGNLTGRDLIAFMRDLRGGGPSEDDELIERFALHEHLAKPLRTLSGGTGQKVNAVLAFLFRPDLLILDEPTAGLDPLSSSILKDRILAERGSGRTVILTSHVMSELDEMADDMAFLLDGRVTYAGTPYDLKRITRQNTLERAVATMMARSEAA